MDGEYPVNLRVDLAPEDGTLLLPGSITITRTTVSVFKLCAALDEEPLFIGVCSIPLIKFARCPSETYPGTDALTVTSVSGHLFVNASLTVGVSLTKSANPGSPGSNSSGIVGSHTTASSRRSSGDEQRKKIENPASWSKLRLEFNDNEACDRCVSALLARHAEEVDSTATSGKGSQRKSNSNRGTSIPRSGGGSKQGRSSVSRSPHHSESTSNDTSVRHSRSEARESAGTPSRSVRGDTAPHSRTATTHSPSEFLRSRGTTSGGALDDVDHRSRRSMTSKHSEVSRSRSGMSRSQGTPSRSAPDDVGRHTEDGTRSEASRSRSGLSRSRGTPSKSALDDAGRHTEDGTRSEVSRSRSEVSRSRSGMSRSRGTPSRGAPDDVGRHTEDGTRSEVSRSRSGLSRSRGTPSRSAPDDVGRHTEDDTHSEVSRSRSEVSRSRSGMSRSRGTPSRGAPDDAEHRSRRSMGSGRSEVVRSAGESVREPRAEGSVSRATSKSSAANVPGGAAISDPMYTCRSAPTGTEGSVSSSNVRHKLLEHHGSDRVPIRAGRGPADIDSEMDIGSARFKSQKVDRGSAASTTSKGSRVGSDLDTSRDSDRLESYRRRSGSPAEFHTPNSRRNVPLSDSEDGRLTPGGLPRRSQNSSFQEADSVSDLRTPRSSLRDLGQDMYVGGAPGSAGNNLDNSRGMYIGSRYQNTATSSVVRSSAGGLRREGVAGGRIDSQATSARTTPYNNSSPQGDSFTARGRAEMLGFMRNLLRFLHHRLHFMQYLHKQVVYEAYLHEEARLCGGRVRSRSILRSSRATSASFEASRISASPRRSLIPPGMEEAQRLREIEERLREVEQLHRSTEMERAELERRQQELEYGRREVEQMRYDVERQRQEVQELLREVSDRWREGDRAGPMGSGSHAGYYNRLEGINDNGRARDTFGYGEAFGSYHSSGNSKLRDSDLLSGNPTDVKALINSKTPPVEETMEEADYPTIFVDRYIYGDEWNSLLPKREAEVRSSAVIDICIALKLPRRLVTVMNVSVEQPGLRLTAEIRHNPEVLTRDVVTRRFSTQPFRFLQRLYDIRHLLCAEESVMSGIARSVPRGSRGTPRNTPLQGSRMLSGGFARPTENSIGYDEVSDEDLVGENMQIDPMYRMRELQRVSDQRRRHRELEGNLMRERKNASLYKQRVHQQLEQVQQEESLCRSRLVLAEVQDRRTVYAIGVPRARSDLLTLRRQLEEKEHVERSLLEVGYFRQTQALMQAHRRGLNYVRVLVQERERRAHHMVLEEEARAELDIMMNPTRWIKFASLPEVNERTRRQRLIAAELKQRMHIYTNIRYFIADAAQSDIDSLFSDEKTARLVLTADEMKSRIDLYSWSQAPGNAYTPRTAAIAAAGVGGLPPQALHALLAEESVERVHLGNDELRRRNLYQREYIVTTEDAARNEIELDELDEHVTMLDSLVQRNRALLERRRQEQQHSVKLLSEEQYYRKSIINDEQDEFEDLMEHIDAALNDILMAGASRLCVLQDFDSPSRRRHVPATPRQTKPFHYMSFAPEDMDHIPTANLAIEGMLGCSINKNLEVTCIARPLPKAEAEELQFQAGDMILDVAGYSLHSLSHLREVLANRAMQIQHEAREEFDDVPEEELLTNPALQKYVEVLCEHHNFLVQVLRGCDIFQIIVKS